MPTLEELIKKEIADNVGHEPTQLELQSCSEYLAASTIKWLVDIELAILDWKNEKTVECAWCGARYLPEEMEFTHESGERVCSPIGERDYRTEHGDH